MKPRLPLPEFSDVEKYSQDGSQNLHPSPQANKIQIEFSQRD